MKHKCKRLICFFVCVTMLLPLLSACSAQQETGNHEDALTIMVGSSNYARTVLQAIREQFPELPLEIDYYSGSNTTEYLYQKITHGETPDIVCSFNVLDEELQKEYLLDLSGYPFVNSYALAFLDQNEIEGRVYLLPGTYTLTSMYYNKTLFAEHGWQVPRNHEELVALVRQIRAESDLTPISFTGLFAGTYFRMMTNYAQCDFLTSPAGENWMERFAAGKASAAEGFGSGLDILSDLIEAGAFDEVDTQNIDGKTYDRLIKREAAMALPLGGQSYFAEAMQSSSDAFGAFPYWGSNAIHPVLTSTKNFYLGLGKQLGEDGNEEKLAAALKVMEYLSSEEGMSRLVSNDAECIPLRDAAAPEGFAPYEDIWEYANRGYVYDYLYTGYEDIIVQGGEAIRAAMFHGAALEDALSVMDQARADSLRPSQEEAALAQVAQTLSKEETLQFIAEFLLDAGEGEISLVTEGGHRDGASNEYGVNGKLFSGPIVTNGYNIILPGRGQGMLATVSMSGAQLKALLENGRMVTEQISGESAPFPYRGAGVDVRMEDGKVTQILLSDGRELSDTDMVTASMVHNDLNAADVTEVFESETSVADAYLAYLARHKTITAP